MSDSDELLKQAQPLISEGFALLEAGKPQAAIAACEQALIPLRELALSEAAIPIAGFRMLFLAHYLIGCTLADAGKIDEGRVHLEQALFVVQQWLALDSDNSDTLQLACESLMRMANLEREIGRPEQSRPMYEEALKLWQQMRAQLGDHPAILRDVSICFAGLADLERDAGRPERARPMYEEMLKLHQQIRAQLGDRPDTLRDVSVSLGRLADLERDAGRPEQARPMYEEALKLKQQIRAQLGDRPDTLRDVSVSLGRLAYLERDAGRPEQARSMYEEALKLDQQIRAQLGDRPDTLRDVSMSLGHLADLERDAGRPEQARPMYEEALKLNQQIRAQLGDRPDTLRDVSVSLGRLADLERDAGRPEQARPMYEEALKLKQQIRAQLGDRPDTLRSVSVSLERLADLERDAGRPEQARPMYEEALKLDQQIRAQLGDRPDTLRDVSVSLGRLADLERDAGRPEQARPMYEEALKLNQQIRAQLGDRPDTLRDVSVSLERLAVGAAFAEEWPLARDHAVEAAELGIAAAIGRLERPIVDMRVRSRLLARIARSHPPSHAAIWPLHRRMAERVNAYVELNDPESVVRARPAINAFHATWLGLAVDTAAEQLPVVVGAAQGRKVSALIQHELQRQLHAGTASAELQTLLKCRERVHQLELQLAGGTLASRSGRSTFGDLADMSTAAKPLDAEAQRRQTEARWSEHRAALEAYEAARAALVAQDPSLAQLQADAQRFELDRLQQDLGPGSALVLLLQAPQEEGRSVRSHALVIREPGVAAQLRALPQLDGLAEQLYAQRTAQPVGDGRSSLTLRDCEGSAWERNSSSTQPPAAAVDVRQALAQGLWAPLQELLGPQGEVAVREVHVVSHGQLHGLPLAEGAPAGLAVRQYPGLVYYGLQRQRQQDGLAWPERVHLGYEFYSPEETGEQASQPQDAQQALKPIPHVYTEAALVGGCWDARDRLLRPAGAQVATVAHLACHGSLRSDQEEDPCLVLQEHRLNLIDLLQGAPSAPVIYLSACLVGRTREDADGDPLGLVGGFMLRGARWVIAALNPISDLYAPLLAYLFHRSLQAQAQARLPLDAPAALADGKAQLQSGRWVAQAVPPHNQHDEEQRSIQAVVQAYAPRLEQQLRSLVLQGDGVTLRPQPESLIQRWLENCMPAVGEPDCFDLAGELLDLLVPPSGAAAQSQPDAAGRLLAQRMAAHRHLLHAHTPAVRSLILDTQVFG